jgi:hypothetical protein
MSSNPSVPTARSAAGSSSTAEHAGPARRLGIIGGVAEVAVSKLMERRLGKLLGSVYHEGEARKYSRLASTLAGTTLMARAGRHRIGAVAAGTLLLTGSLCKRFAVYHAGKQSARDPHHTSIPQKERGGRAVTQPSRRTGNGSSPSGPTR